MQSMHRRVFILMEKGKKKEEQWEKQVCTFTMSVNKKMVVRGGRQSVFREILAILYYKYILGIL